MVGRWIAVLALLVSGLVIGSAAPAAACSCVTDRAEELVDTATVAFVGELTSQRDAERDVVQRFTVSTVFRGDVRRTQDVVTPTGGSAACGVDWETGARMVVLGYVDEGARIAANLCTGSTTARDSADAPALAALGTGSEPLAGEGLVESESGLLDGLPWVLLGVGAVGLAALGVIALRQRRTHSRPAG